MTKLNNNQVQVILTGTFGDGCVITTKTTGNYRTNCKMKDYLELKRSLLGELASNMKYLDKNGFSQTYIWYFSSFSHPDIKTIHNMSLIEKLNCLDELGIALWMYDDGSIHNKNYFYNINTHAFTKEENVIISEFLNEKLGLYSRVMTERKKDGRVFYYIYVPPAGGAYKLSELMSKYEVDSYSYKLYPENLLHDVKTMHEYVDKLYKMGTKEHFDNVTSIRRRFSGFKNKAPDLKIEEFLTDYINRPIYKKKVKNKIRNLNK